MDLRKMDLMDYPSLCLSAGLTQNNGVDLSLDLDDRVSALEDVDSLLELRLVQHNVLVAIMVLLIHRQQ